MYKQKRVFFFIYFLIFYIYFVFGTRFFVAANGVVCFMSVLTLIFNLLMRQQTPQRKDYYFLLFLVDLVSLIFSFLILHVQKRRYMSENRNCRSMLKCYWLRHVLSVKIDFFLNFFYVILVSYTPNCNSFRLVWFGGFDSDFRAYSF